MLATTGAFYNAMGALSQSTIAMYMVGLIVKKCCKSWEKFGQVVAEM